MIEPQFFSHTSLFRLSEGSVELKFDVDAKDHLKSLEFVFRGVSPLDSWLSCSEELKDEYLGFSISKLWNNELALSLKKDHFSFLHYLLDQSLREYLFPNKSEHQNSWKDALCACAGTMKTDFARQVHERAILTLSEATELTGVAGACMKCIEDVLELMPRSEREYHQKKKWYFADKSQKDWVSELRLFARSFFPSGVDFEIVDFRYGNATFKVSKERLDDKTRTDFQRQLSESYSLAPSVHFISF